MSSAEQSLEALQRVVGNIPAQAKREVLLNLAQDTRLNPTGLSTQEINRRLGEIDTGALSEALGETRLQLLYELSNKSGMDEARGAWDERPNRSSEVGRMAIELRSAAKEIIATLARLNEN